MEAFSAILFSSIPSRCFSLRAESAATAECSLPSLEAESDEKTRLVTDPSAAVSQGEVYIRSRLRGAERMMLSTRNRSSAASLAELTTAFFSL